MREREGEKWSEREGLRGEERSERVKESGVREREG